MNTTHKLSRIERTNNRSLLETFLSAGGTNSSSIVSSVMRSASGFTGNVALIINITEVSSADDWGK